MHKAAKPKPLKTSDDNDSFVLSALKDLDGSANDSKSEIDKINLSPSYEKIPKNKITEMKEKTSMRASNSTYYEVSTPPMDSRSIPTSPKSTLISKSHQITGTSVSYTTDFTEDSNRTKDEMTAWERWFVMKQRQIRQRTEIEKKKKMTEEQKADELRKKKAEYNERMQKLWLERKKIEDRTKKETDKEIKMMRDKEATSEHRFEEWYLRKLQEKKSQLQYSKELQKYEELQKEMRKKKNEKAQREWMNKAKQRPNTPRITYAYVGDSVIGFYDSTSHPTPTYINPIPWQS